MYLTRLKMKAVKMYNRLHTKNISEFASFLHIGVSDISNILENLFQDNFNTS